MGNTATAPVLRPITAIALREVVPFVPTAQHWVTLRDLPSEYSYDQALLICKSDSETWIAWVPDHGEIRLDRGQFYRA
jgi:hypothetical protein